MAGRKEKPLCGNKIIHKSYNLGNTYLYYELLHPT